MRRLLVIIIAISVILFALIAMLSFTACTNTEPEIEVEKITLSEVVLSMKVKENKQLTADIFPEEATNKELTWISSNELIATVKDGNVIAVSDGFALITAKSSNGVVSNSCSVNVRIPKEEVKYTDNEKSIINTLTGDDVLYRCFKEPNSVTVRDVKDLVFEDSEGKEIRIGATYYMTLAGTNGFGGTSVDEYVVSYHDVYSLDTYKIVRESVGDSFLRIESIDNVDLDKVNRALKEYYEEKGW